MANNKGFETLSLKDVVLTMQGILEQEKSDLPVLLYLDKNKSGEKIWSIEFDVELGEVQIFGDRCFAITE